MTSIRETVEELLPGAKIIRLKGYFNNKEYKAAKTPVDAWQQADDLSEAEITDWLDRNGWIGAAIPDGRLVIDIDDQNSGEIVTDILEKYQLNFHGIRTPNGYQFIFKEIADQDQEVRQIAKFYTSIGIKVDTRIAKKGYIVFPTEQTENRYIFRTEVRDLSELPRFLIPRRKAGKQDFEFPIDDQGSRNDTLYRFAASLRAWGLEPGEIDSSMKMIYDFLLLDKKDFSFNELQNVIKSALAWELDVPEPYEIKISERRVPIPYRIKQDQLFKVIIKNDHGIEYEDEKRISRSAPHILRELTDLEKNNIFYELAWMYRDKERTEIVAASALTVKRELLKLVEQGLAVNDNNSKDVVEYFDHYLSQIKIGRSLKVERLGWIKGRFIHPLDSGDVLIVPPSNGDRQIIEAFQKKGTLETWKRDVFDRVKGHPKVLFLIFSSLASVILKDLEVESFIVDLSGSTSQGKTTALQVARTVWGTKGLVNEWNATRVSVERKAAFYNSFPLYMDDTRKADERILQSIVYQFSGGKSKGRGSLTGQQDESTWNNILISTGEVSLADFAEKAGGAVARIIPLVDEPFDQIEYLFFHHIYEAIGANYGAPGLSFIQAWKKKKKELIPKFKNVREFYAKKSSGDEVVSRMSLFYSAVHFAAEVACDVLGLDVDLKILERLFESIASETDGLNKPKELLETFLSDLDRSRSDILYDENSSDEIPKQIKGIYHMGTICLMAAYVKDKLGPDNKMIRKEWKKKGYILTNNEKRDTQQVYKRGQNYRVLMVNPSTLDALGYDLSKKSGDVAGNVLKFPFINR
jgi:putative DNA primase/helicase